MFWRIASKNWGIGKIIIGESVTLQPFFNIVF